MLDHASVNLQHIFTTKFADGVSNLNKVDKHPRHKKSVLIDKLESYLHLLRQLS